MEEDRMCIIHGVCLCKIIFTERKIKIALSREELKNIDIPLKGMSVFINGIYYA